MLQWMIEEVRGQENRDSVRELTLRVLVLNFAAIHTTSMVRPIDSIFEIHYLHGLQTFTSTLYFLAAHPELVPGLREEVLKVTEEHGWTKLAMDKLIRMDSFLKEAQRMVGLGSREFTDIQCGLSSAPLTPIIYDASLHDPQSSQGLYFH